MTRAEAIQQYIMHHVQDAQVWELAPFWRVSLPRPLTLHGLMLILALFLLVLAARLFYRKEDEIPHGFSNALELFVQFIRDQVAIPYLGGDDGPLMTPLFCSFFFFILCLNLLGLVPTFGAATGNVSVTASLALVTLAFMILGSMCRHGFLGFWKTMAPAGVPPLVLMLLVPIEFIGLFIKAFALTIRLFANMLAGHIVILALLGLVVLLGWVALPAVLLAVAVYLFEVFIAFLQAYVFTLLSAIFIGQMYHPEH